MAVSNARIEQRPDEAPRRVTILGSTGSVGCNTIDLIDRQPGAFQVEALTAYDNVELLAEQSRRLRPALAVVADPARYAALKEALAGSGVRVAAGPQAVLEAATLPAEWVMAAIVGAAGLAPTLEAVRRGAVVALANKECLVCAGSFRAVPFMSRSMSGSLILMAWMNFGLTMWPPCSRRGSRLNGRLRPPTR